MRLRSTPAPLDVALAVALLGPSLVTIAAGTAPTLDAVGVALAVLAVAPVAMRQVAPLATATVVAVALAAYSLLGYGDWPSAGIGLVVAVFTVATLRGRGASAVALGLAAVVLLVSLTTTDGVTGALVAQAALVFVCAWALGEATRRWARDAEDAAARAAHAVAEERTRLARELHDVVAHHMSVVTVQAGLASYVLRTDPAAAGRAVVHADGAARDALREMRRMLDALRTEDEPAPLEPQPDLEALDALVERVRASGLRVELRRTGGVRETSPGLQLCAYRVVQESLTNVLRHAGPGTSVGVLVTRDEDALRVEVADDGGGTRRRGAEGGGHGLRGMRERAQLYDGELDAGPSPGGGFRVRLSLPVVAAGPGDLRPVQAATR